MTTANGGRTLEDLSIGETVERTFAVGEADIAAFAEVSHDHNPVHLDEAYAATTAFKGRIAHGMLTAAYISAVLGTDLPGPGAVYVSQSLRFKRPVRIGDTVTVRVGVSAIEPRTGVITMSTACVVNGKTVLDGEALVMVPRQKAA